MARVEYEGTEEKIEIYTFRNDCALKIPKRIRQRAFTLQIDIEIVSVLKESYKNFKSNPANSFYGYATLVQRDYTDMIIPIEQPRQRLYFHFNSHAHSSWYELYLYLLYLEDLKYLYDNRLNKIDIAVGVTSGNVTIDCPVKPIWDETTLREIYIECKEGTQFKVEISWWQAKPIEIADCSYNGTSGKTEGDKDDGLPPDGTQPQVTDDSGNPFGGLPSASTQSQLSDLFNNKKNKLDDKNGDNDPIPERGLFGFNIAWTSKCNPTGAPVNYTQRQYPFDFRDTDRISFTPKSPPNICNGENELIAKNVRTGERYTIDAAGFGFWTDGGAAPAVFTERVTNPSLYIPLPPFSPPPS